MEDPARMNAKVLLDEMIGICNQLQQSYELKAHREREKKAPNPAIDGNIQAYSEQLEQLKREFDMRLKNPKFMLFVLKRGNVDLPSRREVLMRLTKNQELINGLSLLTKKPSQRMEERRKLLKAHKLHPL